jgi:beta-carotene hydroxylase
MTEGQLRRAELAIARKYADRLPWEAVAWGLGNLAVWLSLWPLVFLDIMPLWLALPIASINVALCYLPSHEAQHDIIGRVGTKWRWLNELVGHLSTIPLVLPYRVAKLTHLEHHKHANDPLLDPDHGHSFVSGQWNAIVNAIRKRQPGVTDSGMNGYAKVLERIGRPDAILDGALYTLFFYGLHIGLAISGYALEVALLWWLPRHIGSTCPRTKPAVTAIPRHFAARLGTFFQWVCNITSCIIYTPISRLLIRQRPIGRWLICWSSAAVI